MLTNYYNRPVDEIPWEDLDAAASALGPGPGEGGMVEGEGEGEGLDSLLNVLPVYVKVSHGRDMSHVIRNKSSTWPPLPFFETDPFPLLRLDMVVLNFRIVCQWLEPQQLETLMELLCSDSYSHVIEVRDGPP